MLTLNTYTQRNNAVSFGVKIPTRDAISLVTQRPLSNDFMDIFSSADKITERSNNICDFQVCSKQCRDALLNQFPILKKVVKNTDNFFKKPNISEEKTEKFIKKQIEYVGAEELDVQPIIINTSELFDYESDIVYRRPVRAFLRVK